MAKSPPPSESTNRIPEPLFPDSEKIRMSTALNELRRSCRTNEAIKSFEEFEAQLLRKLGLPRQSLRRVGSFTLRSNDLDKDAKIPASGGLKNNMGWNLPHYPGNRSTSTSRISSLNAEAVMSQGSKTFYGNGDLAKSKTTGNLASLIPNMPKRLPVPTSSPGRKLGTTATIAHRRRPSYLECSPEVVTGAVIEREDRAARSAAEACRRSTSRLQSFGLPKSDSQSKLQPSPQIAVQAEHDLCGSSTTKVNAFDPVVGELNCAMFESGHLPPPTQVSDTGASRVHLVKVPVGGKEKLVKSRGRIDRQVSGEIVKNFIGAGMREVKKMGRRVGGWGGSSEDLLLSGNK